MVYFIAVFIHSNSFKIDPDKTKPSVRRGRKAAGLIYSKMAELPKDEPAVSSAFLF
jgi:hypothetical protein